MKCFQRLAVSLVLVGVLAGVGSALADTTNYWGTNSVGSYSGTMNTAPGNWSKGTTPFSTEQVWFTNRQSTPYTNTLSGSITTGPLRVYDDSVVFDLNGYRWTVNDTGAGSVIGTNNTYVMTVKFSSSSPTNVLNGNVYDGGTDAHHPDSMGGPSAASGRNTHVIIDNSLGYPVKVIYAFATSFLYPGADVLVSGSGSEFDFGYANGGNMIGNVLATNGATFRILNIYSGGIGVSGSGATVTVATASSMFTPGGTDVGGYNGNGSVILRDNSTWYDAGAVQVGLDATGAGPYRGSILLDNSSFAGQSMTVGGVNGNGPGPGILTITNAASAIFSNRLVVSAVSNSGVRSTLVLNNGTITLGGGGTPGVLTNFGVMRAAGTIRGGGIAKALVYSGTGSVFAVGSSIGSLTLSNANLTLDVGSQTTWEFSDTGLDQITMIGGAASLLGTNLFTIVGGGNTLTNNGVKWGLGTYDFVVASNVNWSAQYTNITTVLAGHGLVQGVDYQFGVVNLGNGLQALELAFVPEPSTALLLIGGGLMLWRFRRREA